MKSESQVLFPDSLVVKNNSKIVFLIIDGLGGLAMEGQGGTELEVAKIPNLDALASRSTCGLLDPVGPGITPGSGPSHLALFGYDPVRWNIGRGVLSALGVDFPLGERDLAARVNFATVDAQGRVVDRRAGRIPTEKARELCERIQKAVDLSPQANFFLIPEKEHRAALIFRGDGLSAEITDTDPQAVGGPPLECRAKVPEAEATAKLVNRFLAEAHKMLASEKQANALLLRGFAKYERYPTVEERYGLRALAIAKYPMYQGLARLVGMSVEKPYSDYGEMLALLRQNFANYDFFFLHVKEADSRGEDGDFAGKVRVMEEVDKFIPGIVDMKPEVLVVTGDHSTPSLLRVHSWHPVPVILYSKFARADRVDRFDEISCATGGLGTRPMVQLMSLALAHAGRLTKYGA